LYCAAYKVNSVGVQQIWQNSWMHTQWRCILWIVTYCSYFTGHIFMSTHQQNRPNIAGLKCPYIKYVRTSVRPQKVSSISMKFGL